MSDNLFRLSICVFANECKVLPRKIVNNPAIVVSFVILDKKTSKKKGFLVMKIEIDVPNKKISKTLAYLFPIQCLIEVDGLKILEG